MLKNHFWNPLFPGLLLAAIMLSSCASGPAKFTWRPKTLVSWPPGDPEPRIEMVLAYHSQADTERDLGFWKSLTHLLVGEDNQPLVTPYGLALAKNDVLYITDTGRSQVHRLSLIDGSHKILEGTEETPMECPIGVAVLPDDRVWVTDSSKGRILVFSPDGELAMTITPPGGMGRPTGIAYQAAQNRLLVVDTTGCRILSFSPSGKLLGSTGCQGMQPGEFNYPTSLAIAPNGTIVITDSMNFRVQILSADLKPIGQFGMAGRGPGTFASPKGVAVDSEGHIYVVDAMFDNVQIFNPQGELLLAFCNQGSALGKLYLPTGIIIDRQDRIFIADSSNARVQVFKYHSRNKIK